MAIHERRINSTSFNGACEAISEFLLGFVAVTSNAFNPYGIVLIHIECHPCLKGDPGWEAAVAEQNNSS